MSKKQIRFIKGSITDYDEAKMQGVVYFAEDKEQIIVDGIEFGGSNYWYDLQLSEKLEKLFPMGGCVIYTRPINKFSFIGWLNKGKWYSSDGQEGLYNSSSLTTITFKEEGEYILKIVNYTDGRNGLKNVTDNSVKSVLMIGGSNGVTYGVKPINRKAKLIFHNNITNISNGAFDGCKGFTGELILPENLTSIESYAFRSCTGFTGDLIIPENVKSIGDSAFDGCNGFTGDLIIPENVKSIGDSAFRSCTGFTGELKLQEGVTSIGDSAFRSCYRFTGYLIIPESVTSIGKSAFSGCSGLSKIYVCEDTELGAYWNSNTNADVIKYIKG